MDKFQNSFEKILFENIDSKTILKKAVNKKYEDLGIKLEEVKLMEIVNELEAGQGESVIVDIENESLMSSKINFENKVVNTINIEINNSDIEAAFAKISSGISEVFNNSVFTTADDLLERSRRRLTSTLTRNKNARKKYEKEIVKLWGKPIELLEFFISLVIEFGANFNNHYGKTAKENDDIVFEVLLGLFARSCQIASEILVLLKNGFPDGAHARWRTLHEISVVAMFIDKHGKEAAERYLFHACVEDYKGANQHQKYCERTNNIPLTNEEIKEIETEYQNVINQFGENFRYEYGWASEALKNKKPNFSDIERDIKLDQWRPNYKLASHNVHANPMGIAIKLGRLAENSEWLLIGESLIGLDVAGQETAMSLLKVITTLLFRETNMDVCIYCNILEKLEKEISSEFFAAREKVEQLFSKA